MAFHSEGAERRWVRQAVMGVLRWRDLPGTRSSLGGQSSVLRPAAVSEVRRAWDKLFEFNFFDIARWRSEYVKAKI